MAKKQYTNAAIVWLRYRAKYGVSPLTALDAVRGDDIAAHVEAVANLYSEMLLDEYKRTPEELAAEFSDDVGSYFDACRAVNTLTDGDEPHIEIKSKGGKTAGSEPPPYDEYSFTARFAMANMPECLLYEMPFFAIEKLLNTHAAMQPVYDTDASNSAGGDDEIVYRKVTDSREVLRMLGV